MANVYSVRLFKGENLAATTTLSSGCPTGFVWVLRDIRGTYRVQANTFRTTAVQGFKVQTTTGGTLYRTPGLGAVQGYTYSTELRYVLVAGEGFQVVTAEAGWDVYVSGFQLTTP